jgi:ubiquinone/menaquinone biosynthesis C-methylase UbiE
MQEKTFHDIEHEAWSGRANYYDTVFASVSTQAIDDILDSLGPLRGRRHLDVACGTGHLVAAASKRGAISQGIDFAQAMIDVARANYPKSSFQAADARELPYGDRSFDVVTCAFGLSHMEYPQAAVDEAYRVLNTGGRFAFALWFGPENGNELQAIVKKALAAHATTDFTLPERWTQLRGADEQACKAVTGQAGFGAPLFKKLLIVWHASSAQEVADIFCRLSVRTKIVVDHQPPPVQQRIYDQILSEVENRRTNGVISLAWPALLAVVQKPH